MKKGLLILVVCIIFLSGCSLVPSTTTDATGETEDSISSVSKGDFRNVDWGDNIGTIKAKEKARLLEEDTDMLVYDSDLYGIPAYLLYYFDDYKLYKTSYVLKENSNAKGNKYISAYDLWKTSLTKSYGTPIEDDVDNSESNSLVNTAGPGRALQYGYLTYSASWETDVTEVKMSCKATEQRVELTVTYNDKDNPNGF